MPVSKVLANIATGSMTQKELIATYQNALKYPALGEAERQAIVAAAESELRTRFPTAARKLLGRIDDRARDLLGSVQSRIASMYDLSGNRVGNNVKTGGGMKNGTLELDVYISYRDQGGKRAMLNIRQVSLLDEPTVVVSLYHVTRPSIVLSEETMPLGQFDLAAQRYEELLLSMF